MKLFTLRISFVLLSEYSVACFICFFICEMSSDEFPALKRRKVSGSGCSVQKDSRECFGEELSVDIDGVVDDKTNQDESEISSNYDVQLDETENGDFARTAHLSGESESSSVKPKEENQQDIVNGDDSENKAATDCEDLVTQTNAELESLQKTVLENLSLSLTAAPKTEETQDFGVLSALQRDLQKLIESNSNDNASAVKMKEEKLENSNSDPATSEAGSFNPNKIHVAAESFRNICMTLARAKHLNETKEIQVQLGDQQLWEKFNGIGNEMIITRSGRRLFPKLSCTVSGLKPGAMYVLLVDIVPADNRRYRYCGQQEKWLGAGHARQEPPKLMYIHPASPQSGHSWMGKEISFHKLKVQTSNFYEGQSGHTILNSQHRYQPRIHVVQCSDLYRVPQCPFKTFIFPETAFFAVTTYQSTRITEMKIANNPFAKGFRAPGTATQAAGDRHEAKGTENIIIELDNYGAPPFLAAGGTIKFTAVCGKSLKTES